jgi:carboxyl-terminal processing protease
MRRRRSPTPVLVALLPILLVAGIWLGGHPSLLPGFARDVLLGDSEGRLYDEALGIIEDDYYRDVDGGRLVNRSIDQAVRALDDPFSHYFDPRQYASFQETTSGEFEGIGVSIGEDARERGVVIQEVFERSPAARAGLRARDIIVRADDTSLRGGSTEEASAVIRGRPGTSVRLTLLRDGEELVKRVERAKVEVPVVEARLERRGDTPIAHVSLSSFTSGAHGEVGRAVRGLIDRGARGVVLDLRNNGGGLLNEAVLVSSVFIPEGTIVTTRGRARPERRFEASGGAIDARIPVAVLVNDQSASASEIVAGALQDRDRATVVGTRTFGKGVFQEVKRLSNGGALDITVGSYFTPDGRNLGGGGVRQGRGVPPDVRAADDPDTRRDEALQAALRTVAGGV